MATYAIGDVQGCHAELLHLLDHVGFDAARDRLWLTGDLVNRGPRSLEVLRYVRSLGDRAVTVLGNHDLHLVAAALTGRTRPKDTLEAVLAAPDCGDLIAWLRTRPLAHHQDGFLLVHAGVPPQWDLPQVLACAREAEARIADPGSDAFLGSAMYGDRPDRWSADLGGDDRLRFAINCFTRLRFCTPEGAVDLRPKGAPEETPNRLPWFAVPGRRSAGTRVVFGHWSLLGRTHLPEHRAWCLDTGCVWGRNLTALRLDDLQLFTVPALQSYGAD